MTGTSQLSVLLAGNFLSTAGGNRGVCEELAMRLRRAGCAVITTSSKMGKAARLLDMVATAWRRRHEYEIAQVDVFSGPAFVWAESLSVALRAAGKPYVLTLHGGSLPEFAKRNPVRFARLLRSAAAVTTPSRYLLEAFSAHREDIRLIPNGIDIGAYPQRTRTSVGPHLVWLRAFHRIYDPELAIRVLAQLKARFPEAELTMIGPDKGDGSRQAAERLAMDLGVSTQVRFCGNVAKADVPARLSGADIFLNTTTVDNAPVTVIEAMACGLCVVSTNVGGLPYLVDDERDGLLAASREPGALARAIFRILDDAALAQRLSQEARRKAERYDWTPIVSEWQALFTTLAAPANRVIGDRIIGDRVVGD